MLPKITHPTFDVVVPSTQKKIKIRPMLVKEEKILLMAKQSGERLDVLNAVRQIVNNCIVTENVDVNKFAIFDIEFLFLRIRSVSISNVTKVSYRDNEDDKVYDFDIDLDKIELKMDKAPNKTITVSGDTYLELSWPTSEIYADKEFIEASEDKVFELLLANCLAKVHQGDQAYDPRTATKEERLEFIENLPAKSAEQIRQFFANIPSLRYEIKYKNSKGTEREIVLNSLDDFFTL